MGTSTKTTRTVFRTGLLVGALLALTPASLGSAAVGAASDVELHAALTHLRSGGNTARVREHLVAFQAQQSDPALRNDIDLALQHLTTVRPAEREQFARWVQERVAGRRDGTGRVPLDWRYRNFPVFP
jgi:hypothetical protein